MYCNAHLKALAIYKRIIFTNVINNFFKYIKNPRAKTEKEYRNTHKFVLKIGGFLSKFANSTV